MATNPILFAQISNALITFWSKQGLYRHFLTLCHKKLALTLSSMSLTGSNPFLHQRINRELSEISGNCWKMCQRSMQTFRTILWISWKNSLWESKHGSFGVSTFFMIVTLHLAIRSSKWDLRLAAINSMAALFTALAFDRQLSEVNSTAYSWHTHHPTWSSWASLLWRIHSEHNKKAMPLAP